MPSLASLRRGLLIAAAVVLVVVLALSVLAWMQVSRTQPKTSGTLQISGLSAPVTVVRDDRGVPDIYADTLGDLMRAQGYVHAQDRFFEMDLRRHITAGRLAEMVGEPGVETDRVIRTMGWRRVAEAELPMLEPSTRQALQEYAEGVNAWISDQGEPGDMALEYTVLGQQNPDYRVEQWSAVDSLAWLKAMAWDLRGNYDEELTRARLSGVVSDSMLADLFPPYDSESHQPILSPDEWPATSRSGGATSAGGAQSVAPAATPSSGPSSTPSPKGEPAGSSTPEPELSDDETRRVLASTQQAVDTVPQLLGRGEGIGSNSWVVSGERSSTGKPLLANDPHLGISMPGIWYQVGLHCREVTTQCPLEVSGYSFAGLPGVVIGHNADIAWGFTNLGPDVTDFYLELVDDDSGRYTRDGKQVPLTTRREVIKVAGGDDVELTVRSTTHGPIMSDVLPGVAEAGERGDGGGGTGDQAVSLAWTALTPSTTADAIFALNTAKDWGDFREAARDFSVPSQNLVYADTEGNIGYQAPGAIPIRRDRGTGVTPGELPAPGWDSRYDWQGFVDFEDLPWVLNPDDGVIVTANQMVTERRTPYLTSDWDYGYRAQRILDLLTSEEEVTPEKMLRIQDDSRNEFAPTLVPHLMRITLDDPFVTEARDLLAEWDYTQPAGQGEDSAAAAYFNAVWSNVVRLTFNDDLPTDLQASGGSTQMQSVTALLDTPRSGWWDNKLTPGLVEGRDEILRQAMVDARLELTKRLGKEPVDWQWGQLHTADFEHQVLGGDGVPGPVRALFNRGGYEVAGGSSIVNATSWDASKGYEVTAAPSMRMVVDLGDLDASRWVNQTGQSGRPFSDHYTDQAEAWARGETYPWGFSESAVQDAKDDELTLEPKKE